MPNPTRRHVLGLSTVTVAVAGLGLSACQQPPLKVGFLGGLTGRTSDLGVAGRDGALLAVEEVNAAGGVKGRTVELVTADDEQKPMVAPKAFEELQAAGVAAVVGPMTSAVAMAVVPLANAVGLTLVSPTVTTSALTGVDDQFFRVISSTHEYAVVSARFHAQRNGLRRLAVILDRSNAAYTERWLDDFEAEFRAQGGKVIRREAYVYETGMSFQALTQRALASPVEGLLLLMGAMDAAQVLQQVRKVSPGLTVMTSEWPATEQLLSLAGDAAEGMYSAQFMDRTSQSPRYLRFVKAYRERFGNDSGFAGLAAYDAMHVVLQALAAQHKGESFKQTLLRVQKFEGAQQEVRFNANGDAMRDTFITKVKRGRYEVMS